MSFLAELRSKRAVLDEAIRSLEALEALEGGAYVTDAQHAAVVLALEAGPAGGAIREARAAVRSDVTSRPMAARAEAAVRRALVEGHNRPKTIRESTGLAKWKVDDALKALESAGVIEGSGTTRARVYRLL